MNKAFTSEENNQEETELTADAPTLPQGSKNYITPIGAKKLKDELHFLLYVERPEITQKVSWAAGNGDRSENADYQYNKRRLRQIDSRIRFLQKRIEAFDIVDPASICSDQIVFGATVTLLDEEDNKKTYSIVGIDEMNASLGKISWISPLAKAMLKKRMGDLVSFQSPKGLRELEIILVEYKNID